MNIDYKVPFYSNTPDDTHCLQAGFKSILKYFTPERDYSWEDLDKATAKLTDMWTWPMAGLVWIKRQGFDVKNIELFDYPAFIKNPRKYLADKYGPGVAAVQLKNSDISQEVEFAKEFIKEIDTQYREATRKDMTDYLQSGYLVAANVNYRSLHDLPGYVGHFVIVKGVKDGDFIIHDPGLPPVENMTVSFSQFEKGWAFPSDKERNIMAFKKQRNK